MPSQLNAPAAVPGGANLENKFSGWTDREILGLDQDRLKFEHYAGVLAEIIQEADTPLTVGIFGSWGSGKTSLMRLIKDTLDKADDKTQFKTLWFDAWTFDKEDALWRAVILLVLKELRKEIPETDKEAVKKLNDLEASLYRDVDREELGGVTVDWPKAGKAAASGLTRLSLSLIPGVGTFLAKAVEEAQKQLGGSNLDSLFDAVQRERQKIHREHIASLEQFQLGFAELLKNHFVDKKRRLVVFIDDLDRCLPEKAISVLEAIKLFLDAPGCVYVIGTDRDVIEQGIRVKYKDFFVGEASAVPITGDSYLEKIIQIPFHMPPLQEERIQDFIAQYDTSVPDDCAAILAVGIEPNPRKVKRILNVFRLLQKLAEKRVVEKEIDQFDPGLLAKIVVIQSRWRELYKDLQEYPNLIQDLERFYRDATTVQLGSSTRLALLKAQAESESINLSSTADLNSKVELGTDYLKDRLASSNPEQGTLLQRHAVSKAFGKMLMLPPFFESLKIDQIQLYLYMTHTVVAEAETKKEAVGTDQPPWDDLLSNDPTKISAAAEAIQAEEGQAEFFARRLLNVISGKKEFSTQQRVSSGSALGYLGDPRFRADAWYLPDDPLLGFAEIPAGPFVMGSDPKRDPSAQEDEQPQHEVILPIYYIARYPVMTAQFNAFVDIKKHKPADMSSLRGLPNHPVVNITWNDALAYCDWLTKALRQWPDMPQPLAGLLRQSNWQVTLPSEAEWEKAARGGLSSPVASSRSGDGGGVGGGGRIYPWGDEFDPNKANTNETGIGSTSAVGCFPAGVSPYGLLDLSGNVWEWTRSLWGKKGESPDFKYPYDPKDVRREDLKAPDNVLRVIRGGSWSSGASSARCPFRDGYPPDHRYLDLGLRCVLRFS